MEKWRVALILFDYLDRSFTISQPKKSYQYHIGNFQTAADCPNPQRTDPPAEPCDSTFADNDPRNAPFDYFAAAQATFEANVPADVRAMFDNRYFVSAGQDESATWQEFPRACSGSMCFGPNGSVTAWPSATSRAETRPKRRAPAWPSSRTSSRTTSACPTTTTTRSPCSRNARRAACGT